mgnify:CR=1 FL=1
MFHIALDAGHGRNTPGKRCLKSIDPAETREWTLNDRICDKIEQNLKEYDGYTLLRVDDTTGETDVPLAERIKKANDAGADFYLSVHHNAGVNGGTGGGIIAIVYTQPSDLSVARQKIVYDNIIQQTGLIGNRSVPLARQNLYVLRETNMPSVLVECGFMDSVTDVPVILSETFSNQAAKGLTDALVQIGGLKKKERAAEGTFEDIQGHYAEKQINELYQMGIVTGVDPQHFAPDEAIKRADAAIIARNVIRYITGK